MDYQELHSFESSRANKQQEALSDSIDKLTEAREILDKHLALAEKKGDDYALSQAYDDDGEKEIAEMIRDDKKLDHTSALVSKKAGEVSRREQLIEAMRSQISQTRGLLEAISNFNPNQAQAKRKFVQDEFVFAKGGNWLEWNKERRRQQEGRTNSRFKTFVDIFSRHNFRVFPKAEGKYGKMDFDSIPLDGVVVDPEKITDSFLESMQNRRFGLVPVSKDKHQLDRLRTKVEMIPHVRRFFQNHISPLNRAGWDDEDVNWRLLVVEGYHPSHDGKIINPRGDSREKPEERNKIMYVYNSAYSARRGASGVFADYEKESSVLYTIKWQLELVRKKLMKVKKGDSDESSVIQSSKDKLKELVGLLGNPNDSENPRKPDNVYKAKAYEKLFTSAELKDIKGRINKGASLAKLVSVCDKLQYRLEEVDDTSIAGPENQNTLNSEIIQSENVLESYGDAFQAYLDDNEESRSSFEELNGSLAKIKVRPFNFYSRRLQKCLRQMKGEKDSSRKDELASRGLAIVNLFKIQKYVEEQITQNSKMPTELTDILFSQLDKLRQLAGELRVSDCDGIFELFTDRLDELKTEIETALAEEYGMSPYNSRTILKAIDFSEILRKGF